MNKKLLKEIELLKEKIDLVISLSLSIKSELKNNQQELGAVILMLTNHTNMLCERLWLFAVSEPDEVP